MSHLGIAVWEDGVGPAAEAAVVPIGLALHAHLQVGGDPVVEDVVAAPSPPRQLTRQHVLAPTLDDGRVGGDVGIGRQHFHSVPAEAHVASAKYNKMILE